ncbi:MAG: bifunctional diaminohydroxyphosphoribosylaminopyrimidine deaminase/5-amino-6-(5-phosphoribosylamino)uracil reductase RibD [Dehalococcoidales bacterium]|nr:bifunctional diaminohydroxyphosphoribosylaminopyrimidine deaminase/5-amino-6-(5-phosphoribosylamino)uracil reductase RibD [Dehalococcoidales bacterium]
MDYMERAISLAKLALGQVSPNPAVGAVIVKDDEVVGQGYTQPPGSAHAEVIALEQAGDRANGAVMYVTLEPCCHYGRTPPCTQAIIIAAGIKEVHAAMIDPNPIVLGNGLKELEKAGIKIFLGEHAEEAREIIEAYIKFITTGKPFVTVKFAMSLDGKIATRSGDSKWISGDESRRFVHNLRYTTDAIMVGVNTVIADDPKLTSRYNYRGGTAKKQPLRVITDATGRTPVTARVFNVPGKALLALGGKVSLSQKEAYVKLGAEVLELPAKRGLVSLEELLVELGKKQLTSVLVEGGASLLGSFFDRGLVDKVMVFIAPIIIGGDKARTAIGGKGVDKVVNSLKLERVKSKRFDADLMITGYIGGR